MSAYCYKYTDLKDNNVKYVGIVFGEKRRLIDRIIEHEKDGWFKSTNEWLIEYHEVDNRSIAESYESHYISLYNPCFNISKKCWGINKLLPEVKWCVFSDNDRVIKNKLSETYDRNAVSTYHNKLSNIIIRIPSKETCGIDYKEKIIEVLKERANESGITPISMNTYILNLIENDTGISIPRGLKMLKNGTV